MVVLLLNHVDLRPDYTRFEMKLVRLVLPSTHVYINRQKKERRRRPAHVRIMPL